MKKLVAFILIIGFLGGCDQQPFSTDYQEKEISCSERDKKENQTNSPGLLEHMATSAISGAAAGGSAAAAHEGTKHLINRYKARKRAKAINRLRSRRMAYGKH